MSVEAATNNTDTERPITERIAEEPGAAAKAIGMQWWKGWERFWFSRISAAPMVLVRTAFGLLLFYWGCAFLPAVGDFFGPEGIDPNPTQPWYHLSFFQLSNFLNGKWFPTWLFPVITPMAVVIMLLVSAVALVIGRGTKIAGPLAWFCTLSLYHRNRLIWNGGDDLVRLMALYIGAWCLFTPRKLADINLVEGYRKGFGAVSVWGLRLLQIQLVVIYWSTAFEKLRGASWSNGSAAQRAMRLANMQRFPVPEFIIGNSIIMTLITWATLALEIGIPIMLFKKRTRVIAIVLGICLHLSIEYAFRVGIFSTCMTVLYLSWLSREQIVGGLGFVLGKFGIERQRPADARPTESADLAKDLATNLPA